MESSGEKCLEIFRETPEMIFIYKNGLIIKLIVFNWNALVPPFIIHEV